jgi:hypothetical protein
MFPASWLWKTAVRSASLGVGALYPALATAKAAVTGSEDGFDTWGTYWIVWSLLAAVQGVTDLFLESSVPLYSEAKLLILIWLALPKFQGAARLYHMFIQPSFTRYESQIDGKLEEVHVHASRHARKVTAHIATEAIRAVRQSTSQLSIKSIYQLAQIQLEAVADQGPENAQVQELVLVAASNNAMVIPMDTDEDNLGNVG